MFLCQVYPLGAIVAVIDSRAEAEKALRALKAAGVPEGEVDLVDGQWFVQAVRHIKERRGLLGRVLASMGAEEEITRQNAEEAEQGHTVVVVHAEQPEVCGGVVRVLAEHGTHAMHHFGKLVITDL